MLYRTHSALRTGLTTTGAAALGLILSAMPALAFDKTEAARSLGYASEVWAMHRCPEQETVANDLSDDILAYWHFSAEDTEGQTALGRTVTAGRAAARRDAGARGFCGKLGVTLAQLRTEVLPR